MIRRLVACVCLGALGWACSVYDSPIASPIEPGAGGSSGGLLPMGSGGSGGGAAGIVDGAVTTGAAGSVGSAGSGGAGGTDADAAAGGQGGRSGGAGSGGQGVGGNKLDGAVDGSTSDAIADARPDAAPDSGCPNPTLCATLKAALVHRYSFDGTGTQVTDSVGTAHGIVVNAQLSGSGAVALAGTTTDQFVDLPNGIIRQLINATFEVWLTWTVTGGWQRIFDFGDSGATDGGRGQAATTFYLTPRAMIVPSFPGPEVMLVGFKRANQTSDVETHLLATQPLPLGTIEHVVVVVDDTNDTMTLYHNGALEGSIAFTDSLSILNDVNNWLGRSQYTADAGLGGTIYEFRIYNVALSQAAVQASFTAGTNPPFLN